MRWLAACVALVTLGGCEEKRRPFVWEDALGHRCSPLCGEESCATDLDCNVEPSQPCDGVDADGVPFEACWDVWTHGRRDRLHGALGENAAALCESCCTPTTWSTSSAIDELCSPLICDPAGQAPPAPFECRPTDGDALIPGYVYYTEEESP